MSSNILLDYNINYTLVENLDKNDILKNYKIMPIEDKTLYILVATSNIAQDTTPLNKIFNKPIKFIKVNHIYLEFEWQYLDLKIELYKLSQNIIDDHTIEPNNSYIIKFMDTIFLFCIQNLASDIHLETIEHSIIFRFRIDGMLNQFFRFNISLYPAISSIVKYLSSLDISQQRLPLNGRFSRVLGDKKYDFRLSTMPTIYGESIVIRILDNQNVQKDLIDIGFEDKTLEEIKQSLTISSGMILVTGPTGSGKTTTLYSMLNHINTKEKKIITIEDPIEYKLDGIIQVAINNDIELDYKTVLKNILRQDPDILMIGEIRDKESLQIAMQASLTGHLVISTLHTNSALETITRLKDLEAPEYLIASTIRMILSQRLVRVLCVECKKLDKSLNCYRATGCTKCNLTGYLNRKVVTEILRFDNNIKKMITDKSSLVDIEKYIFQNDFISLEQNGQQLVKDGITSWEEYYSKI